jgi:hypothetical protein
LSDWGEQGQVVMLVKGDVDGQGVVVEEQGEWFRCSAGVKTEAWQVHMMLPKTVFLAITEAVP